MTGLRKRHNAEVEVKEIDGVLHKQCIYCHLFKPFDQYSIAMKGQFLRKNYCKKCKAEKELEREQAKRKKHGTSSGYR